MHGVGSCRESGQQEAGQGNLLPISNQSNWLNGFIFQTWHKFKVHKAFPEPTLLILITRRELTTETLELEP